jgi:periplasmic protein TonB
MGKPSAVQGRDVDAPVKSVPAPVVEIIPVGRRAPKPDVHPEIKPAFRFSKAILLEENHIKSGSRTLSGAIAVLLHVVVIAGPIVAGLYYTDSINIKQFASTTLVAPPPPPPPPPPATGAVIKSKVVHHTLVNAGKLLAPTVIPKHIAEIKEAPLEPDSFGGVAGGVPGGVPGGQMGGVLGGVIGGVLNTAARPAPPPPSVKPKGPVRVGGHVRPPKIIVKVQPEYPPLARQVHIQGQVQIDAVLDEQGNVIEMKVVSGPPLLYQAALNALKKWKYEPTYLNDRPIAVQMIVTVTFQLGQQQ